MHSSTPRSPTRRSPSSRYGRPRRSPAVLAAAIATLSLAACGGEGASSHPWIDLGPDSPHRIIEAMGSSGGQAVIVMPATVSREEALALGRLILSQAPASAAVNVRLYNDEETARNWRTVEAQWTLQHLLVVVQVVPGTGLSEVRWVGPELP